MRDEVLEDHLLDVAVLGLDRRDRLERGDPLLQRLPDADQDPGGEGNPKFAGQPRSSPAASPGAWSASPGGPPGPGLIDSSIRPWDAVTSRSRARSSRERTPRFVWGSRPRSSAALAGPDDVRGEVLVAPLPQSLGNLGIDLGPLAGEDQELLRVPAHRLVQAALDLIRIVDVRPVRREGAVLAVALARPRERERVVARKGHPAHGRENLAKWVYQAGVSTSPRCRPGATTAEVHRPGPGRTTAAAVEPRPPAEPGHAGRRCPPTPARGRWTAR